ncbi:MAG: nitrile hydratase accessory protein [Rhizobiaceae bacterium]|nr:nitrile hydratase accessory protein [Rhizobiaceae bacterium]
MNDESVFAEPWQAQAFALALALQDAGVISPKEWSEALGARRDAANAAPDGSDYYDSVVATLEELLAARGIASKAMLEELSLAWIRAAHATPHGRPVELSNDPAWPGRT